jgi:dienelactone hydrolase
VVVDVAYRLFPETDLVGMVMDAKRAIAWVRAQATGLGIDPERIVLVGGSAGGHLSLLTAYGHDDPALVPPELAGADLRVSAVVSLYGQVGLDTMYEHTCQDEICRPDDPQPDWNARPSRTLVRLFGAARVTVHVLERFLAAMSFTSARTTPDAVTGGRPGAASHALEAPSASARQPCTSIVPRRTPWLDRASARGVATKVTDATPLRDSVALVTAR